MFRAAIVIAIFFSSAAAAALGTQHLSPNHSTTAAKTYRTEAFNQLSMGPDPGGKTGATVTPETTKTGQPPTDGAATSKQSGTSGAAAPAAQRDSADPSTGLASRADALKQQPESTATQPTSTGSTSPSNTGQGR
jgi:hypothetical protein